jgi:hypothetical protein
MSRADGERDRAIQNLAYRTRKYVPTIRQDIDLLEKVVKKYDEQKTRRPLRTSEHHDVQVLRPKSAESMSGVEKDQEAGHSSPHLHLLYRHQRGNSEEVPILQQAAMTSRLEVEMMSRHVSNLVMYWIDTHCGWC